MFLRRLLMLSFVCLATGGRADVVTLMNGDRLSGTVTAGTGGSLLLETQLFGVLRIPAEQVVAIVQDGALRNTDGDEPAGLRLVADGQPLPEAEPTAIVDLEQDLEDTVTYSGADWVNRLDFGYVLATGNSETESSSVNFEGTLKLGKRAHRAFVNWNHEEADGETTRNQLDVGYGLRWYFLEPWFAAANLGYFQDELKEIDRRITLGLSFGYQFVDNRLTDFSTGLGLVQVFEALADENESNPALRWSVNYRRWLRPERVEYFYGHEVLSIFDASRGEVYKANNGIRFMLGEFWSAHARLDAVHETNPPEGREQTDLIYTVGFGFTF